MPKILSEAEAETYKKDGYACPVRIMSEDEAAQFRKRFEAYEEANGGWYELSKGQKLYLLQTWAADLVRHPKVLDAVEDVLGPDLFCWGQSLFVKDAHDPGFVSMHQDGTYWGLSEPDVVTAWIALSPATELSGCMKVVPGTHLMELQEHTDTLDENNLLTRGQEIAVDVDEKDAVFMPLQPGEMSLHHVRLVHGSAPNQSDDRRIGVAIRYIAPHVKQKEADKDSAWLVRGEDKYGYFLHETPPNADMDAAAMAEHKRIMALRQGVLYKGVAGKPAHTDLPDGM
ncbi:MAG: phytanoyl-CoA dioxygenase family protein [Alphaproteobacteria bacterium]